MPDPVSTWMVTVTSSYVAGCNQPPSSTATSVHIINE